MSLSSTSSLSKEPDVRIEDCLRLAWGQGDLSWKLWPQQEPIYNAIRSLPKHTEPIVVLCARQFGKSFLGTLLAVEDCLRNPGVAVLVVGPTIDQTTAIVNQAMRNIISDAPEGLIRPSKSEGRWYVGKSELVVGGFDQRMASRKRGLTIFRIYIEEVVDSHPDEYLESVRSDLGPMLTHSKDASMIFLSTLPRVPDHPFIVHTIPAAKLKNAFYSYTINDNAQLSETQRRAIIERSGGVESIAFRREYLNEIIRDPTIVVVPPYNEKLHVADYDLPPYTNMQTMIDWGGVRDKTVALLMTYEYGSDTDLVWDEAVFEPNTPTSEIVRGIRKMEAGHTVTRCADAPGQIQVDLSTEHAFQVSAPYKNDWQANVNFMNERYQCGRVIIHPRCKFLRLSLQSGTLNKRRNDFERSEALGHCDALAAHMYGLRCLNRSNPWPQIQMERQVFQDKIVFKKPQEVPEAARALAPKSFIGGTSSKKFGTFRR